MPPELSLSAWAQIRADYEHSETPVEDICAEHGISSATLRDRMRRWNWTRRRQPIPLDGPPPMPASPIDDAAPLVAVMPPLDRAALAVPDTAQAETAAFFAAPHAAGGQAAPAEPAKIAQRLQAAVARVLPAIEATLVKLAGSTHPREMERAARALAALTRTLRELNALLAQHAVDDDEPKTLDEFRQRLLRKMDQVLATGRTGDGAEPERT
jgi:hypothetical protein